jgi:hypothetical protein
MSLNKKNEKSSRIYFSSELLHSVGVFDRLSDSIEKRFLNNRVSNKVIHIDKHRAYVVGAIFCAVAFLDAVINAIYEDAEAYTLGIESPKGPRYFKKLGCGSIFRLANFNEIMRWRGTLEKYQQAFILANKVPFKKEIAPFNDIKLVITMRNALVHYRSEWKKTVKKIEPSGITFKEIWGKLKNKFSLNPFAKTTDPFFPDKCLSNGCVKWVAKSSITFVNEFFERMNIPGEFDYNPEKREYDEWIRLGE